MVNTRGLKIITGLGILLLLLVLALEFVPELVNSAKPASTSISLHISSDGGKLTVYVPVLLDENGDVPEMFERAKITGSATSTIIDTDRGKMLKILGAGVIDIVMGQSGSILVRESAENEKFMNGFTLSTSNATRYGLIRQADAWVYSEEEGTVLRLSVRRDNGWGKDMRITTGQDVILTRGWQSVGLSVTNLMND